MSDNGGMVKSGDRRDTRITIRIPESLKVALEQRAERERRSVSDMAVLILTDALARKGR